MIEHISFSACMTTNSRINGINYKKYNNWECLPNYMFKTVYLGSYLSAISELYTSDYFVKLVYHQEIPFVKLDISWCTIIH